MRCWKCNAEQKSLPDGKLPFRATCEQCDFYLHTCVNCKYYKQGQPNDCLIPGTEFVRDRETFNYCDEFVPKGKEGNQTTTPSDVAKKLFGDDDFPTKNSDSKDAFNSLFND
jgi:hypothetical protein